MTKNTSGDNLDLLKSIHENGGEFEVWVNQGEYFEIQSEEYPNIRIKYRIPSELEVEKKIVGLAKQQGIWESLEHKEDFGESNYHESLSGHEYQLNPVWDIDNDCSFAGNSYLRESHESRLTAGLMLWDKLQKERNQNEKR